MNNTVMVVSEGPRREDYSWMPGYRELTLSCGHAKGWHDREGPTPTEISKLAILALQAGGTPQEVAAEVGLSYTYVVKLARGDIYVAKAKRAGA